MSISPVHYEGLLRKEPLEIPENALREAIFNAIIHKNYMGTAIQLKVYNDRVQLWNYGGLPENHTTDWLLSPHTSIPRNSLRKTKDNMRKLREAGLIRHIGPNKGGHWEVIGPEQ